MSSPNTRKDIADLLRSCVSSFPLYEPSHFFQAHQSGGQIDVEYASHPFLTSLHHTGIEIHLAVKGKMGYGGWAMIPKELRGKGHGSKLVECAEDFFRKMGCVEVETTASGKDKHKFYEKLGYVIVNEAIVVMRKKL